MSAKPVVLFAVPDVSATELQLHVRPRTGAACLLFGWDIEPEPVDAEPPRRIADIFAHALLRVGRVALLHPPISKGNDEGWRTAADDEWLGLSPTLAQRLRGHQSIAVVATRRPQRVIELFCGDVSWSQQMQVGFVLREGALPVLSYGQVTGVVAARDADFSGLSLPAEIAALVLPAVDGDYVEFVARDAAVSNSTREAIGNECESRGIPFEERSNWRRHPHA